MDNLIDKKNLKKISELVPEVRGLAERHIALCKAEGIDLLVVCAYRSPGEQEKLYARGRDGQGKIVTNAAAGGSWHNFRRAYDVAVVEGGKIDWESVRYKRVGEIGSSLGLVWGGGFKAVRGDLGHFEYHPGMTLAQARRLL